MYRYYQTLFINLQRRKGNPPNVKPSKQQAK